MKKQTTHSGVIAYRIDDKGAVEILLIRNLKGVRWMIPKGWNEEGMTPRQVALMEAWEEAGVKGKIKGEPLGVYKHQKFREVVQVELYIMKVTGEKNSWPEMGRRKRQWLPIAKAAKKVAAPQLKRLIPAAEEAIRREEGLMKEFYLIRHGKSSHDSGAATDFERPLNKRGLRDSREMGRRLKKRGFKPDLIISSPANRAAGTAQLVAGEIEYPEENIRYDEDLYLCDVIDFEDILKDLDESISKVIIFAHNPGIHMAERYFSGISRDNVPTCGICAFETMAWDKVGKKRCREIYYDYPKNVVH